MVCHGGLGKQDGQPSSEDVGDELIGYSVLKKEVHYSQTMKLGENLGKRPASRVVLKKRALKFHYHDEETRIINAS